MELILPAKLAKDAATVLHAATLHSPKALPSEKAVLLKQDGDRLLLETCSGRVHLKMYLKGLTGRLDRNLILGAHQFYAALRNHVSATEEGSLVLSTSNHLHAEGLLNFGKTKVRIENYISSWSKEWLKPEPDATSASYNGQQMKELLGFLLLPLPPPFVEEPHYYGITFQRDEMLATDANRIHVQSQMPQLCEEPRTASAYGFHSLDHFLRFFPTRADVAISHHKRGGFFQIECVGYSAGVEAALEMQVHEDKTYPQADQLRYQLSPLPQSFSVVISATELMQTLSEISLQELSSKKRPGVELHLGQVGDQWWLRYCTPEEDYAGPDMVEGLCGQSVAWAQTPPTGQVGLSLDARYLRDLISTFGPWIRIFFQDPATSPWTPIYIDGWGPEAPVGRFGILAPTAGVYYQAAVGGSR